MTIDASSAICPPKMALACWMLVAGSGVVSRYLAGRFPQAAILGCDQSRHVLSEAIRAARGLTNLSFVERDLFDSGFENNCFDYVLSRFMLSHVNHDDLCLMISKFFRILAPGGGIVLVDVGGIILNVYPRAARSEPRSTVPLAVLPGP